MRDRQSVSCVLATCAVAMCSLALRKFLHLSEFSLVIADSSTSIHSKADTARCAGAKLLRFPDDRNVLIMAEGY